MKNHMASESRSVVSDSLRPQGLYSPRNSPGQNPGVGSLSLSPGDLPNPGIEPRSPTLQPDSLPAELPGKPKNTGVGSLSLLQQISLTQESTQGLLHCRWTYNTCLMALCYTYFCAWLSYHWTVNFLWTETVTYLQRALQSSLYRVQCWSLIHFSTIQ